MMTRTRRIQRCTRVKFTLFRCASADLFFYCFDSVAVLRQKHRNHDQLAAKTTSGAAGIGLGTTIKFPRRTTGAAAGSGLGTTLNYLRGAAGNVRAKRLSTFDAQRAPPQTTT
jgi:hypothetical protein